MSSQLVVAFVVDALADDAGFFVEEKGHYATFSRTPERDSAMR